MLDLPDVIGTETGPADPVKKNWKDFDPELRELAQAMLIGDRLRSEEVYERIDQITQGMNDKDAGRIKNLFTGYVSDGLSSVATGAEGSGGVDQKSVVKNLLTSSSLLNGLKTGAGIAQIIDGIAKKKNLTPPRLPDGYKKSDKLASEITKAIYRSEQGDPRMREAYDQKIAEANDIDNFRAKLSGNIGQYAANIQGNAIKRSKALNEFALANEEIKRRGRSDLNNLIDADIAEDRFIAGQEERMYRTQRDEYERGVQDIQRQINSGFNNTFKGLSGLSSDMGYLASIPDPVSASSGARGPVDPVTPLPSGEIAPLQSNTPQALPELKNYELGLLGNDHYRQNQELVNKLRSSTGNYKEGPWDDDDEAIRRKLLMSPFPNYMGGF